ncbi:hypothetical protein POM88_049972 [Heracleum sosnowskyi]|uniref:Uncharacterized protein n=1 Tax=Heracleum sosnowskyi TaxID=360622 RepID=A0AAD8M115_9APIA|nr:hypothetical protein POM88_049972 [Heracleum sosnowskyi]
MLKKNYWDKVGLSPYNYKWSDCGAGMFVGGRLHWCLCLIVMNLWREIRELWAMNEYGVQESWIKISVDISKVNPQVPLHLQENNLVEMDNGQSFLVVSNSEAKEYNCTKVSISHSITEAGMGYVESLVS